MVTKEVHDALLLSINSHIDSWMMDVRAPFYTTAHHGIMKDFVARNYGMYILLIENLWTQLEDVKQVYTKN